MWNRKLLAVFVTALPCILLGVGLHHEFMLYEIGYKLDMNGAYSPEFVQKYNLFNTQGQTTGSEEDKSTIGFFDGDNSLCTSDMKTRNIGETGCCEFLMANQVLYFLALSCSFLVFLLVLIFPGDFWNNADWSWSKFFYFLLSAVGFFACLTVIIIINTQFKSPYCGDVGEYDFIDEYFKLLPEISFLFTSTAILGVIFLGSLIMVYFKREAKEKLISDSVQNLVF